MTDLIDTLNQQLSDCYAVERELGGGGMSRVFVALEKKLERRVVIKVLPDDVAAGISADRFRREIQFAAKLQHPHIVPVLSAGEVNGKPYFTMPFIEGESLRQRIARDGELPVEDAVRLLRDLASALAYAHKNGVVHRDIKPDNVMLEDEYAVVTDFGIAKALSASSVADPAGARFTTAGVTIGTPAYMSPEQVTADPSLDHRADIYAFGVVAYEVLTGLTPFAGRSMQALLAAQAIEKPEHISNRRPALPSWLAELVMRCLEKRPADRPQAATELLRALQTTANVTKDNPPSAASRPPRKLLPLVVGIAALLVISAAILTFGLNRDRTPATAASGTIQSVAVLPLVNVGGRQEDEYFSDGMSDEIANVLSKIPGLRVASRTSAHSFKGRNMNVAEIGRALNVQAVLEGTVRRAGGKLRVTGQLTSVRDGLSLWTDSYERDAIDVFAVQDDIARSIADALKLRLASPTVVGQSAGVGTANLGAYDHYLRGRYFWNARGGENIRRAISYFGEALAADSGFARAYAARAIAYALLPEYSDESHSESLQKAIADARKALALDSTLAEAHTGLALASVHMREWDAAERSYKQAIKLDPQYPTAHQWYGELLYHTSRLDSSVAETRRARQLDPLAPILATAHTYSLIVARRYDEALVEAKRGLELAPDLGVLQWVSAQVYLGLGNNAEARRRIEIAAKADSEMTLRQGQLAYVYGATGDRAAATSVLKGMQANSKGEDSHPVAFAIAYLALGDTARALGLLEQAEERRDIGLLTAATLLDDPLYAPIRKSPRFLRIMQRMDLARFMD